jgi:hypothetical protein
MSAANPTEQSIYPPTEAVLVDVSLNDQLFPENNALRAVSIGTAGTLKVDMPNASGIVIPANALAVGVQHILHITKIYKAPDTTAAEIVGWR